MNQLLDMAALMLLDKRVVQVTPEKLHRLQMSAILHWDLSHFVVVKAVRRGYAVLHDPDRGEIRLKLADLSRHLTGIAIEFTPPAGLRPKMNASRYVFSISQAVLAGASVVWASSGAGCPPSTGT